MTNPYMEDELRFPLEYHITETKDRAIIIGVVLVLLILLIIVNYNTLTKYFFNLIYSCDLELYYREVGDFITVAIQLILFIGLIGLIPFFSYQIALYIYPALSTIEIKILHPLFVFFFTNYFISFVAYFYLIIFRTFDLGAVFGIISIEAGLAWTVYFTMIVLLFILTESVLSIPIFMLSLHLIWNISYTSMRRGWNYMLVIASIIAAIITPTTDPLTQLIFMFILLVIYIVGLGVVGL